MDHWGWPWRSLPGGSHQSPLRGNSLAGNHADWGGSARQAGRPTHSFISAWKQVQSTHNVTSGSWKFVRFVSRPYFYTPGLRAPATVCIHFHICEGCTSTVQTLYVLVLKLLRFGIYFRIITVEKPSWVHGQAVITSYIRRAMWLTRCRVWQRSGYRKGTCSAIFQIFIVTKYDGLQLEQLHSVTVRIYIWLHLLWPKILNKRNCYFLARILTEYFWNIMFIGPCIIFIVA